MVGLGQQSYAREILDSLCDSRYDGRGYVNNGVNRAADFLVRELKKIGVQPVKNHSFTQPYSFNVNTFPYPIEVVLGEDTLSPGSDYLLHPYSGTAQGLFKLIEINESNFYTQYEGAIDLSTSAEGQNIYAFNFVSVTDKTLLQKIKEMATKAMNYFPIIWVEKNKQMFSVGRGQYNFPMITIDSAHYRTEETARLKINNLYSPKFESKNVIGYIPGQKKNKFIVLSAHFDHLGRMGSDSYFPGANDNASGVAMLLSLAKYYIQHPAKYSVIFCFFSGEEAGLEGSHYFVQHPFVKLNKIKFVLNIDIMGSAADGITIVNGTKHEADFQQFVSINEANKFIPTIKSRGPTANSDHYFFSELDIPAFFIYSMGSVKNYHDIYDSAENTPLENFDAVQNLLIEFIKTK